MWARIVFFYYLLNDIALAGFFSKSAGEVPWGSSRRLTEYIRRIDSTMI